MNNLDFLFEEDNLSEKTMIRDISIVVNEINKLSDKIKYWLRHLWLQIIGILICYFFSISSTATIFFSVASIISFLLSSRFYGKRKEKISYYWFIIREYQRKKILTKENKHLIEDLSVEKLWFED